MREAYFRAAAELYDMEATVGLEMREGDDADETTAVLKMVCGAALTFFRKDHVLVAADIEQWVLHNYPGRAYFIETEDDGKGVQVYDPRDFVKTRCVCAP